MNCEEGRSSDHWVDFNLFGHQLVIHYKPKAEIEDLHHNPVDGHDVPVPHYGVVLPWSTFQSFSEELKSKGKQFVIEPYIRFEGQHHFSRENRLEGPIFGILYLLLDIRKP